MNQLVDYNKRSFTILGKKKFFNSTTHKKFIEKTVHCTRTFGLLKYYMECHHRWRTCDYDLNLRLTSRTSWIFIHIKKYVVGVMTSTSLTNLQIYLNSLVWWICENFCYTTLDAQTKLLSPLKILSRDNL